MPRHPTEPSFLDKLAATSRRPASVDASSSGTMAPYDLGDVLGRGGMGQVILAHDSRIGRDVALKRMVADDPDPVAVERFVREARIQARLEHPSIVPVHEIGLDVDGLPFFTMKRLSGTTLAAQLAGSEATQKRLLRALVEVCNAIDLAHSQRVVHRDLKPSNIMLGNFGEVYVIDWGVARMLDDATPEPPSGPIAAGTLTQTGALIGTPGYMAPEQLRGEPAAPPADVYALGAILFEILSGERLRPADWTPSSTLHAIDVEGSTVRDLTPSAVPPATRRPDRAIAPELDRVCFTALSDDPAKRPTARELGEHIQRYLDGDRDLEQRRALAAEQLDAARAAMPDPARRSEAVRAAGRALALDPKSTDARDVVAMLLVAPPSVDPPELAAAVAAEDGRVVDENGKRGAIAFGALLAGLTPVALLLHVRSWALLAIVYAAIVACLIMSRFIRAKGPLELTLTFILAVMFSRVAGPFVLTPVLICAMMPSLSQIPWINEHRWSLLLWAVLCGVTPFLLEGLGVFGATWWVDDGPGILSSSAIFEQAGILGATVTVFGDLAFLAVLALYMHQVTSDRRSAERKLQVQNWHLRQLLPRRTM